MIEDQMMEIQDGVNPPGLSKTAIQIIQVLPLLLGIKANNNSNTEIQVIKVSTINGPIKRIRSQVLFPNCSKFYFVQHVKFFEALVDAMTARSIPGLTAHGMDAKLHWGKTSLVTSVKIMQLGWDIRLEPAAGLIKLLHGNQHSTSPSVSSLGT